MSWVEDVYRGDPKLKPEDVQSLVEWAKLQPHLPAMTENEIILFLQSCYYRNELAKSAIDNYFTMKTFSQELFGNRNPKDPQLATAMNTSIYTILPEKTPEGYSICYAKLIDCNPDNFNFALSLRLFDMMVMAHLNQFGPMEGIVVALDMQGAVFGHLTKLGPVVMKKFLYYLQDAMPIRLKAIHYFNIVPFMDKILALMKPFMKKELMDMLHLHDTTEGLLKFFPKDCLPKEYGGKADPIPQLHDDMKKYFMKNAEFFAHQDKQLVDESKRPGKPKNAGEIFGVEGTFKKLDID